MNVLDLFSGAGGMSRGLEKAGMKTVAFCEKDNDCCAILEHYWPGVTVFRDIAVLATLSTSRKGSVALYENKSVHASALMLENGIDVICGGPPCTGHSVGGNKNGFENEESRLWYEYLRLIGEIKPKYCIIENSANIGNTGLVEMLKDISALDYNVEGQIISGYSIGAPHQRRRLYLVLWREDVPYCDPFRRFRAYLEKEKATSWWWTSRRIKRSPLFKQAGKIEPRVLQFTNGVSKEVLECTEKKIEIMGNSLFPQIPELIGRAIMENENGKKS